MSILKNGQEQIGQISWELPFALGMAVGAALVHLKANGERNPTQDGLCGLAFATDGVRASGRQHSIQNHYADGSFGLLSIKSPWKRL